MFLTLCILSHPGSFFQSIPTWVPQQTSETRMWGAHTTFLTLQRAYILSLSLYTGPAIQCALEEAAVTRVGQQSCSPVGQHPWQRELDVEYLPSSPLSNCPWNTNFGNPRTSKHIQDQHDTTAELSLHRGGTENPRDTEAWEFQRKAVGGGGWDGSSILRNLCILTSKYTITPATEGFLNAAIAISVSYST